MPERGDDRPIQPAQGATPPPPTEDASTGISAAGKGVPPPAGAREPDPSTLSAFVSRRIDLSPMNSGYSLPSLVTARDEIHDFLKSLPEWSVLLDDQEEPWYRLPDDFPKEGSPHPEAGVILASVNTEGETVFFYPGWDDNEIDPGVLTVQDRVADAAEMAQFSPEGQKVALGTPREAFIADLAMVVETLQQRHAKLIADCREHGAKWTPVQEATWEGMMTAYHNILRGELEPMLGHWKRGDQFSREGERIAWAARDVESD